MKFTVLGASGFIGSHLISYLKEMEGTECFAPSKSDPAIFEDNLGHVIYSIGLTADFRERPFDAVKAHVCHLADILEKSRFESMLYLSSTRIYNKTSEGNEDCLFKVDPQNFSDLYNISKLMGESLCLSTCRPGIRIVRLSNVYGYDHSSQNFLDTIIKEATEQKNIVLKTGLASEKDFICIDDVTNLLPMIAVSGKAKIYNVASGINISNNMLMEKLQQLTGCSVQVVNDAPNIIYPKINIDRIRIEFGFMPSCILESLEDLVNRYQRSEF